MWLLESDAWGHIPRALVSVSHGRVSWLLWALVSSTEKKKKKKSIMIIMLPIL